MGRVTLSTIDKCRVVEAALAAPLALWVIIGLRTGKTIWIRRGSAPRIVSRKSNSVGYWTMILNWSAVLALLIALAVFPQIRF